MRAGSGVCRLPPSLPTHVTDAAGAQAGQAPCRVRRYVQACSGLLTQGSSIAASPGVQQSHPCRQGAGSALADPYADRPEQLQVPASQPKQPAQADCAARGCASDADGPASKSAASLQRPDSSHPAQSGLERTAEAASLQRPHSCRLTQSGLERTAEAASLQRPHSSRLTQSDLECTAEAATLTRQTVTGRVHGPAQTLSFSHTQSAPLCW